MIYDLRHRTTFSYEDPVTYARCVLRLTPQTSAEQTTLRHSISVRPRPAQSTHGIGPFGEKTLTVILDRPHEELVIEAHSRVDVHVPPAGDPADTPAWDEIRTRVFQSSDLSPTGPASYLYPTGRTPMIPAITDYARQSFQTGRPLMEAALDLTRRLHADFIYDPEATTVQTPAAEAFSARRGVCQDFAHIMICGLRGLGLPAAYVSGYLRTRPPPGKPRLEGADATHAWVNLWLGEARGWVGFDPTNAIVVQDDHIVLAMGRDYADVAPIDGIILDPGEQTLTVAVDVVPVEPETIPA